MPRVDRRTFLASGLLAAAAPSIVGRLGRGYRAVLTTDFAVPHGDPDDYYDVACAVALRFQGVVLDELADSPEARRVLREVGAARLDSRAIRGADAVVVVGAATHAARHFRAGQRVVLFAGDAAGVRETNELLDVDAFDFLRRRGAIWVPCFDGGGFKGSSRASWTLTTDDTLLDGLPVKEWFVRYCGDTYGDRSLYGGPLIRFAWADTWRGTTAQPFKAGPTFAADMVTGTRRLLSRVSILHRT